MAPLAHLTFQRAEDSGFSLNAGLAVRVRPPPRNGGVAQRQSTQKSPRSALVRCFQRPSIRNIGGNKWAYWAIAGRTSAVFRFQTSDT